MTRVGVLALQGDVAEHASKLGEIGVEPVLVKRPGDMEGVDGLIIPGGESTTIGKLLVTFGLVEGLRERVAQGFPIWGTCAGLILLAQRVAEDTAMAGQQLIAAMDVSVRRNGFGRQLDSFETGLKVAALGDEPFPGVFIRAPYISEVGPRVEVLARLSDGRIVAARQDNLVATAFHPELTTDNRFHAYFAGIVEGKR